MRNSLLCLISLLVYPVLPVLGQPDNYEGDVTDLRILRHVDQHPDAWRIWQPTIHHWKKNHLLVAYGAMTNGKKDMGDVFAMISRNDGDTWEEPVAIFDHNDRHGTIQFAYANPVLFQAEGESIIWCFAMRCSIQQENSEESGLAAAYTADGGRSWNPVELAMHYTGPLITNGKIFETEINGEKRYLLPAHRNTLAADPRGDRSHFVLSSTSLLEWKREAYIPQPKKTRVFLHEGNIAQWKPGELKIVMRTANYDDSGKTTNPPRAYSSISRDGGHTWSPAVPEPDLHNAKSKGFFGRSENGTHIYVYNDGPAQRDKSWPDFPNGGRTSLRYKTKAPGKDWSEQKTLFHAGVKNSYPTLCEVAPGEFRAVWDSGTETRSRTNIMFGKLNINK